MLDKEVLWPPYTMNGEYLGESPIENPKIYDMTQRSLKWIYRNQPIIVSGEENIPFADEKVIITPTHGGVGDILAVANTFETRGRLSFLSAREVMSKPVLGGLLRLFSTISITKGQFDPATFIESSKRLYFKNDNGVVIFPEGKLRKTKTIDDIHRGPSILACANNALVCPVGIAGPEEKPWRPYGTPFFTHIGEPFLAPYIDISKKSTEKVLRLTPGDRKISMGVKELMLKGMQDALAKVKEIQSEYYERLSSRNSGYKKSSKKDQLYVAAEFQKEIRQKAKNSDNFS